MKKLLSALLLFVAGVSFAAPPFIPPGAPGAQSAYDQNGAYVGVLTPQFNQAGFYGFVPPTQNYAGVMAALRAAVASPVASNILFENVTYNLGSNYIPIVSGIGYIGSPPRLNYLTNHDGQGNSTVAGTTIQCSATACMWDGASPLSALVSTVAAQSSTTTSGSANIAVPNSALFTVGQRVYLTAPGGGFKAGIAYYVLSAGSNIITLGLPDMTAINATSSATIGIASSFPNDSTSGVSIRDLSFTSCNTAIQTGAKNTGGLLYSKIENIQVHCGNPAAYSISLSNFSEITVSRINSNDGNGQYYGSNSPANAFQWGNSDFFDLINNSNGTGSTPIAQQGILFQAETGSALNEVRAFGVQNDTAYVSTVSQTATPSASSSPNINVTDSTKFPVGIPVWTSTVSNPNGFTTSVVYWVVSSSSNVITLASTKSGTAINSTGTTSMTLNTQGFPGLEIVGVTTGVVENSSFLNLDIEGNSTALINVQHTTASLDINQASASDGHVVIVGRNFTGKFSDYLATASNDFDFTSNVDWYGMRGTSYQNLYSKGIWYDTTLGQYVLNLNVGNNSGNADIQNVVTPAGGPLLKAKSPIVDQIVPQDTSKTFSFPDGISTFNGATGQTYTLPTITNGSVATSMLGWPLKVFNASGNNLTVATNGTQTLMNQAGFTSMTLTPGQYAIYVACITGGGTLFWCVQTNGTL